TPYEQGYHNVLVKLALEDEGPGVGAPIAGALVGGGLGMAGGGVGSMYHAMKQTPRAFEYGAAGLHNNQAIRKMLKGNAGDTGSLRVIRNAANKDVPFKDALKSQFKRQNRAATALTGKFKRWGGRGGLLGAGLGLGAGLLSMSGD
ncbi:hypothetical protein, partial [Neptuniibacter sp.]|uniref:hypothetical protein n=1 Tax=Neptuniibacter sp. TaxID=1962643 RepID=UPI00263078F2